MGRSRTILISILIVFISITCHSSSIFNTKPTWNIDLDMSIRVEQGKDGYVELSSTKENGWKYRVYPCGKIMKLKWTEIHPNQESTNISTLDMIYHGVGKEVFRGEYYLDKDYILRAK